MASTVPTAPDAAPDGAAIRRTLGDLDAELIAEIQALRPSEAELLEAAQWLGSDDSAARELHHRPHGVVGAICELVEPAEPDER